MISFLAWNVLPQSQQISLGILDDGEEREIEHGPLLPYQPSASGKNGFQASIDGADGDLKEDLVQAIRAASVQASGDRFASTVLLRSCSHDKGMIISPAARYRSGVPSEHFLVKCRRPLYIIGWNVEGPDGVEIAHDTSLEGVKILFLAVDALRALSPSVEQ